jgi:FkbM family methyltransferase
LVPDILPANPIVVDAGANVGAFAIAMAEEFHGRCFAIEPSPQVFEQIPAGTYLNKYRVALAGASGEVDLHIGGNSEATSMHKAICETYLTTIRTPAFTLEEFCRSVKINRIDLLKMDIEGEELAVLNSCSEDFLKQIGQITVEFHEWMGQGSAADVRRIIKRLRKLGFWAFNVGRTTYFDVLFVNRRNMSPTSFTISWMNLWTPRVIGSFFRRFVARRGNQT